MKKNTTIKIMKLFQIVCEKYFFVVPLRVFQIELALWYPEFLTRHTLYMLILGIGTIPVGLEVPEALSSIEFRCQVHEYIVFS